MRNLVRRIGYQDRRNLNLRDQGYVAEYPWLLPLIPIGADMHRDKGIKFENLTGGILLTPRSGVVYLVDEFGQALSVAGEGLGSMTIAHQFQQAVKKLPVNEAYVRYAVQVRYQGGFYIRIYRVDKGTLLSKNVSDLVTAEFEARAQAGKEVVLANERALEVARQEAATHSV